MTTTASPHPDRQGAATRRGTESHGDGAAPGDGGGSPPGALPGRRQRTAARWGAWAVALAGVAGAVGAAGSDASAARAAAEQDWPPFVLVTGLLLVGLVAAEEGLFHAAGRRVGRAGMGGALAYASAVVLVAAVTSVLNLDTSVAFLTPVLVHAARARGDNAARYLYACILLSNAASLLLPGSNLTNLIVLGHLHLSGGEFLRRSVGPWAAAVAVTAVVAATAGARSGRTELPPEDDAAPRTVVGVGAAAVVAVLVLVLVLRSPALPVAAVGLAAVTARLVRDRRPVAPVVQAVGLPALVGLFGVAVALGTLGREWSGPATALGHLDAWGTAAVAAGASVLVNNLPAASLLAARVPHRPLALIVGLDIGPNLFVTGSLSWLLWYKAARTTGARPSLRRASLLGAASALAATAAALGVLTLAGGR